MATPRLGAMQMRIMRVLWRRGEATATAITEELRRECRVAHSTVQTLLRQLEEKNAVAHTARGREFVWRPRIEEDRVTSSATRRFLKDVFEGSAFGLVAHLLRNEKLTDEEFERIRDLVDKEPS
ncbi:MAG: BlaI/MecI/CopY family transcriptional regulator [Planctomycetes bacterium]|nr:BlaI/MecI/CopY family transcriptional regulator [Planctomycetota bacterium]